MLLWHVFLFVLGFVLIWQGAGLIIRAASKFSSRLKLSAFAFSFVFLGILTSVPELSVGLQAVAERKAAIFVGNLLGGIMVLFLVVIPLLAVAGRRISIRHELDNRLLLATLGVIIMPVVLLLDGRLTKLEGAVMAISYLVLLYLVERQHGIFDRSAAQLLEMKAYSYKDLLRLILGVAITFVASHVIVDQTVYFGSQLRVPSFYIGLLVLAIGTDLPELTLAIKSVLSGKKQIAMGDYLGAAAVSTFMFGLFTLLHSGDVIVKTNFILTCSLMTLALAYYYYIFRRRGVIRWTNGIVMFALYLVFVAAEVLTR